MDHPVIFIALSLSFFVACKRDEATPPALATRVTDAGQAASTDAARPTLAKCRFIDGSARVEYDDDPKGENPRVHDCTWEWADDPCPDAKPGVDQRERLRR